MMRCRFDGNVEERTSPKKLSGSDIFQQVKDIHVTFGRPTELNRKRERNKQRNDGERGTQQWRKKSIFFDLSYWESNLLRHNLNVMHIEKNVFDNIIYSLLNDKEKSKDHIKARKDLQDMGIRRDLWPDENGECRLGAFTIPKKKKVAFLKTLKNISVPLLPITIRNVLPNQVVATLVELSSFFRQLCMKYDLEKLQNRILETSSHLDILFPLSFFTIMIHLTVHLVDEVKQGGPVHYRWMYFFERLLGHFKSLVRNKSQSEGSIAEGNKVEEVLTLYSHYFDEIESRLNRPKRVNYEPNHNEASGKSSMFPQQAKTISDDMKFLAQGPAQDARRFSAYNINGFKFRTLSREQGSKTQNSGVFLISDTSCIASSVDRCARQADMPYYEKLEDIIELNYYGRFKVVLFKCLWAGTTRNRGYKTDA
ncbi:hypothetical protein KY285_010168 [Solanum tuberosum]|nr:hypothetical protein KY285_010168 [Solanum tuberosum]